MKSVLGIGLGLGLAVMIGLPVKADFHSSRDKANFRLNKPPAQKLSRRIQKSMDRLAKGGIEDARLREMLARNSVDKTADGALIRADRLKNPRARINAYQQILGNKVHPNNLKYRLKIIYIIQRQAIRARYSKAEHANLKLQIANTRRQICEIERTGYSQSRPPEKFTRQLRDADRCLKQACELLKQLDKPCSVGSPGTQSVRVVPDRPPLKARPRPSSNSRPAAVDPRGGRLRETQLFYVAGLPQNTSTPLRSAPSRVAPVIGQLRAGDRIAARTPPGSRDKKRGWVRICPTPRGCGWIEEKYVTHGSQHAAARRAVDYYLIGLQSASVRGMLDLVTGDAQQKYENLSRRYPGKKMKDIATERPERWTAHCAACDGDICQLLYSIYGGVKLERDQIVFETRKDRDGKYRLAANRNYVGKDRRWFDAMHPRCWKR